VPVETATLVTDLLIAERRRRGTGVGSRAASAVTIQVVSGIQTFPLVSSVRTSKGRRPCLAAVDR
jgi:hypothetical protein